MPRTACGSIRPRAKGCGASPFGEAVGRLRAAAAASGAGSRPALAFAFTQEPIALRLAAVRKKPQVTIRQLLVARIEQGVVKYQATFYYTILYSGVKSLRIDVPAEAVGVRNVAPAIRDKAIDPPPADLAKGSAAWSFTGQAELIGNGKIELVWEKKIDHLDVGKSVEIGIPRLIPRGVDRAWGQIVLAKAETLDVQPAGEPKGLRPIDPQRDLIAEVPGAAAAFRIPRRLGPDRRRHPIPVGGDQTDQHRPGRGADGRHPGRRDQRAGGLSRPERPAAIDDSSARQSAVRR